MVEAFVLGLEFPKDALSQYPVSFAVYKHDLLAPAEFVLFQCFVEYEVQTRQYDYVTSDFS